MSYHKSDNKYYGYIYKITNLINNRIYIGQTRRTVKIRFTQHINDSKRENTNTILYRAFKKYGVDNFIVDTIKEYSCINEKDLIDILNKEEIMYIAKYNSTYPNGYNMQDGGKSPTKSMMTPVDKYDLSGNYICSYKSASDASNACGVSTGHSHIIECCKGKLHTCYGFIWRYHGESFDKYSYNKDKRTRSVSVYDLQYNIIGIYDTIKNAMLDVMHEYDIRKMSHICSCCSGVRNKAYGYIWKYND